jgi:hypothetical protein
MPIALAQDVWSSQLMTAFMGIYSHFIEKNWVLHTLPLDLVILNGAHSVKNLVHHFFTATSKYLFTEASVIMCDNASNNDTFIFRVRVRLRTATYGFFGKLPLYELRVFFGCRMS